ncbi:adhesion G-protein coupled receptor G5 [Sarotherodon galilaeus]
MGTRGLALIILLSVLHLLSMQIPSKPTVTLQPSWTQIYSDKPKAKLRADNTAVPVGGSVTLTCSVNPSSSSGWKYYWYRDEKSSEALTTQDAVFHSNGQISVSQEGLYRCRGGRGNPVYYTEDSQSVRIGKTGWSFYWYKAVPDLSEKSSSYELLPDGSGTAQDSYIIHGQTHTAGYVCRAGRGDPEYHTDHSQPKFVWSADVHSAASLTVSPDRVQHFTSDSVSLTCEGNFTEWRVRKFSEDGRLYSDCRRMTGSTCNINTSKSDTAVYWCESGSGEFSSAVNITVQITKEVKVLHKRLQNDPNLSNSTTLSTDQVCLLLELCLHSTYFTYKAVLCQMFCVPTERGIISETSGRLKLIAGIKADLMIFPNLLPHREIFRTPLFGFCETAAQLVSDIHW